MVTKDKKKIRLALIGGGINSSIGPSHLSALNSSGNWQIICGIFGKNKNKYSKLIQNSSLRTYNNIENLIKAEKKNIDCVLLLTPPKENKKIIYKLIKTKLPIISEKPIFNSFKNFYKINFLLNQKKIKFLTTYNYSFYPALKELKYLIKKNPKKLNKIIIEMPQQSFFLKGLNIKKWRKTDNDIPNLFLDLGSHLYNLSFYLLDIYPTNLLCKVNYKNNVVVDSNIWCKFKNNSEGIFWISKNAGGHDNDLKIEIIFDDKSYIWEHKNPDNLTYTNNKGQKILITRANKNLKYLNSPSLNIYKAGHPTGFLETFINFYNDAYKKISNKKYRIKEIDFNFEHSYKILNILESMKKSFKKKKWIKINVK